MTSALKFCRMSVQHLPCELKSKGRIAGFLWILELLVFVFHAEVRGAFA
jgi:hypothetical protein